MIKRICVFCGSSSGASPVYLETAKKVGEIIAARGVGLVYGGARCGLMGAVANAAFENGAEVIGVIPEALIEKEIAHVGVSDLRVVSSMHERKMLMSDLADAFIALPGGHGHAGRTMRNTHLGATRLAQETLRPAERRGVLSSSHLLL